MSLKYAPNLTREEVEALLKEEDTCCLGLCREGEPYVVPVSYAFLNGRLIVHCAKTGKKLDILRENPRVSFTVFRHPDKVKPHPEGEKCTYRFESVIGTGTARIVEDPAERLTLLNAFLAWFDQRLENPHTPIPPKAAEGCAVFVIEIDSLSGRKKG